MSQINSKQNIDGEFKNRKLSLLEFDEMIKTAPMKSSNLENKKKNEISEVLKSNHSLNHKAEDEILNSLESLTSQKYARDTANVPALSPQIQESSASKLNRFKDDDFDFEDNTTSDIKSSSNPSKNAPTLLKFQESQGEFDDLDVEPENLKFPDENKLKLNKFRDDEEDAFDFSNESISKKKPFLITKFKPKSSSSNNHTEEATEISGIEEDVELDLTNFKGKVNPQLKSISPVTSKIQKILPIIESPLHTYKSENHDQITELINKAREIIKNHEVQQKEQAQYNTMIIQQKEYFINSIKQVDRDLTAAFSKLDELKARKENAIQSTIANSNQKSDKDVLIN